MATAIPQSSTAHRSSFASSSSSKRSSGTAAVTSNNNNNEKYGVPVTASLHKNLEDLLALLLPDDDTNDSTRAESSAMVKTVDPNKADKRLVKRVGTLLDRLTELNFSMDQIKCVMSAVGAEITEESALDWLCLHLPTDQLPPLFTEGQVRDATTTSKSTLADPLTVIVPVRTMAGDGDAENNDNDIDTDNKINKETQTHKEAILHQDQESSNVSNMKKVSVQDSSAFKEEEEAKALQKAWLLTQYQYEEGDKEEQAEADEGLLANIVPGMEATDISGQRINTNPDTDDTKTREELSPEETQLEEAKEELRVIETDANDEASNNMRSKYEIKDLQEKVRTLRQGVNGIERKVAKQRAERRRQQQQAASLVNEEVNGQHQESDVAKKDESSERSEEEQCTDGDIFSMFEEDTAAETIKSEEKKKHDDGHNERFR
jgi:hypothetical protein